MILRKIKVCEIEFNLFFHINYYTMAKERKINKSAKDGKFVSNNDIKKKPATTYQQTVKVTKAKKKQ